ncbi:MAG TPA: FAD/NAD(P)-binding oxidoreductase, partial [Gammaproteobacteria bacterium]
ELREALGTGHRITVVSNTDHFSFIPSNPWVAVGWRSRADVSFPLEPYLRKKQIEFTSVGASEIRPDDNEVVLGDGTTLHYDYLVIATGPKLAFDEVQGMGPGGFSQSICTLDHAEHAYQAWQRFLQDPGPIVVGAAPMASCFGPAYEYAFILDAELRRRKLRHKVPMTFVTSEPYIGHLGLGGVGDSRGMLESELRDKHIKWITNARIDSIEESRMQVSEQQADGETLQKHELPFHYSMILPAFKGVDAIAAVGEDLVNPRGFVKVDAFQRNPKWNNIYSVGVCIAIPPVEATPVPTGAPKTGYMIESMVKATVANIQAGIEGREVNATATWNAICLADMGDTGIAFVAMPQIPPRNTQWMKKGKWVHLAKVAFEKYFIRKMKKGTSEPFYETVILKAMGIEKLN